MIAAIGGNLTLEEGTTYSLACELSRVQMKEKGDDAGPSKKTTKIGMQ
jgi:hypothetical protein